MNFLRVESYKKGIFFSSAFNMIAKLLLFCTNLAVAYYFGTQVKTDVYFYCIAAISLFAVYITSIDSSVLIPESMHLAEQKGKDSAMLFLNTFLYLYLGIGVLITAMFFIDPFSIFASISRFEIHSLYDNSSVILFSIPMLTFLIINTYLIDILASYKYFTMPMISSIINSLVALSFLFLFHKSLDITSLVIGLLFASMLQSILLLYVMKTSLDWKFSFRLLSPGTRNIKNIFFASLGNITALLSSYIPLFLLSGFGPGIIASLNYGQQVSNIPTGLITTQFSSVAGIKFNELSARKDFQGMDRSFLDSARFLLFVLFPVSFLMSLYSSEIITLLYKRGSFGQSSVMISASFLRYFSLILPFYAISTLVSRLFMANQKIIQAFWYQIIFNTVLFAAVYAGVKNFGAMGYPAALILVYIINILAYYILLKVIFPMINYGSLLRYTFVLLSINAALLVFTYWIKASLVSLPALLSVSAGCLAYISGIFVINMLFRINMEIHGVIVNIKQYLFKKLAL